MATLAAPRATRRSDSVVTADSVRAGPAGRPASGRPTRGPPSLPELPTYVLCSLLPPWKASLVRVEHHRAAACSGCFFGAGPRPPSPERVTAMARNRTRPTRSTPTTAARMYLRAFDPPVAMALYWTIET